MTTALTSHAARPVSDQISHPPRYLLHPLRPTFRWLIRRKYDVRVHHADRFPRRGPVVVAANHVGWIDGPLLAIFSPRPVHALTKSEMFAGRLGRFLQASGQISVDRHRVDPRAVRTCVRVLRDGGAVGLFPEGTRGNGELGRFHTGAAYLAMVTGAVVVPVTFLGTREPGGHTDSLPAKGARIDMVIAQPLSLAQHPWPRNKTAVAQCSLKLRDHMLIEMRSALAETGRSLPGDLPAGEHETLRGNVVEGRNERD